MSYALSIDMVRPFDEVVPLVKDALAANGFGIVAEIDMQKILALKIGVEIEPHLILGACNPRFAHQGRLDDHAGRVLAGGELELRPAENVPFAPGVRHPFT